MAAAISALDGGAMAYRCEFMSINIEEVQISVMNSDSHPHRGQEQH